VSLLEDIEEPFRGLYDKLMITPEDGLYTTHPLIREYCHHRFENLEEIHRRAADYYIGKYEKEKFDSKLEEEIYFHLSRAKDFSTISERILEMGEEFVFKGHTNLLLEIIDTLKKEGIEQPGFMVFLGDIDEIRGNWNEALKYFDKALSSASSDERLQAEAFIKYGEMRYRKGFIKESLSYFEDAYKMCKGKHRREEARALNDIGLVKEDFGDLKGAEKDLRDALALRIEIGNEWDIGTSHLSVGSICEHKGDLRGALDNYEKALIIAERIEDKEGISSALLFIGGIHRIKLQLEEALFNFEKSLAIAKEVGDKAGISGALSRIGEIYKLNNDIAGAMNRHKESLQISKEIGSQSGIASSLVSIGSIYKKMKKSEEALRNCEKSLRIFEEMGDKDGVRSVLNNIGLLLEGRGKKTEALGKYKRSLAIARECGVKAGISITCVNIGDIYLKSKDYKSALEYFFIALSLNNEMEIPATDELDDIYKIKNALKSKGFKEAATEAFSRLEEERKAFIDLDELIASKTPVSSEKVGRNAPCICGSGKKYKRCCLTQ
ncbi:MAG: tetratricopeptide repeat protein, partial [Thermodesulfobacteriota bacterium]